MSDEPVQWIDRSASRVPLEAFIGSTNPEVGWNIRLGIEWAAAMGIQDINLHSLFAS